MAVCYMEDRVDPELLKRLLRKIRIRVLDVDALRMNQQTLAEMSV